MTRERASALFHEAYEVWRECGRIINDAEKWNDYDNVIVVSANRVEAVKMMIIFAAKHPEDQLESKIPPGYISAT